MSRRLKGTLLSLIAGTVAALGQAPFDLSGMMMLGIFIGFETMRRVRNPFEAATVGFVVGFAYFAITLHWIVSPFLVDAAQHGWMAPFAVILMAAGGALFWSLAFYLSRRLSAQLWVLIPCWAGVELLRAYVFTGFPWATPAQAMVDTLGGQVLAWIGPHGLNLLMLAVAYAFAMLGSQTIAMRFATWAVLIVLIWSRPEMSPPVMTQTVLRLVQPNAPQHEKWDPEKIGIFYERQLRFTAAPADPNMSAPDAVIWPETAIPWNLTYSETILREISAAARGKPVILGVQRTEEGRHYNSLVTLGPEGDVTQLYDKHHLVPFGEYVPLGNFMARFGIYGMAPQHGAGFSAGEGAALLDLGPLGLALPLICYEAVFAHDVNASPARPDFIIHATNDAWFGTYAGPQQHLAQARMRAIEQGLPVARAANTGISAMIDPHGRILRSLGMGEAGYIDAPLPAPLAPTLYSRTGDWPVVVLLLVLAGVLRISAGTVRKPNSD
ncbi:apolipoprotein N-acyltransferase [uncultured Sulfitobacter sp.]|uniref:apolipoprotein N-acyltransferase n=1 Tax=uncultured Sulfitobacter sp. TaxID=191468 RepID=UPI002629C946|nr:apolipoprotein N-acyltransferase [uncultured Sulfitobacter sp.]